MNRRKPSTLSLTDLFCGAGGVPQEAADVGVEIVMAVNHWKMAVDTYGLNFPDARVDCQDISKTDPRRYPATHLLWASPECITFSQAQGKRRNFTGQLGLTEDLEPLPTEAEERSRVTMWDVLRFTECHDYRAVVVENVVDIMPWALLDVWIDGFHKLGYDHRTLMLNSMFLGVPQSRDRVYFVFWKRGKKAPDLEFRPQAWCHGCEANVAALQHWKKPHYPVGRYRAQYTYVCPIGHGEVFPWVRPAAAVIDWSVLGERIGSNRFGPRGNRPLAVSTLARIQAGIDRYWTVPAVLAQQLRTQQVGHAAAYPAPPQRLLAELRGTSDEALSRTAHPADSVPLGTLTAGGTHHGVVEGPEPLYVKNYGDASKAGPMSHPVSEPLGAITGKDHHNLLSPPLTVPTRGPGAHRVTSARPVDGPMATLLGELDRGLLVPAGGSWRSKARSTAEPMATRTGTENDGLVVPMDQTGRGPKLRSRVATAEPLRTQTSLQADGVLTPPLVAKAAGSTYEAPGGSYKRIRPADDEPLWTQTGTSETGVVNPPDSLLAPYYGHGKARPLDDSMPTLTGHERHGLAQGAAQIAIEDCFFRMLLVPEIGRGMAFRETHQVLGNKSERVQLYGQAVTPPVPRWLFERIVGWLS